MKSTTKLTAEYRRLTNSLSATSWISHGYVQDRGPGAGGPCYQWTRKERGKTISVALSKDQYLWMRKAITNWRKLQAVLTRMEQVSRTIMFTTLPDTRRRKPLSLNAMGLK
jgi:hypothetical protein